MGITAVYELTRGRSVTGRLGETSTYTRTFAVRVDDPGTSLVDIVNANGVSYFDPHPDDPSCVALEYDCQGGDDTGMWYTNTVRYMVPPIKEYEQGNDPSKIPEDQWSAAASISSGPVTRDNQGKPIVNAAKDPIGGLEKDYAEFRITLVRAYLNMAWSAGALAYTNAVNSSAWNGGPPRTWKCHFQSAQKVKENNQGFTLTYWSTTWDFAFRPETWDLKEGCENVGLNELKNGKRYAIRDDQGAPIASPVALTTSGGVASAGTEPSIINGGAGVKVYREMDFSIFGVPG
jgi:hypothetical protein